MITTSVVIAAFVCFVAWNNCPDLIEVIGKFLVAHAKSIRNRAAIFNELMEEK